MISSKFNSFPRSKKNCCSVITALRLTIFWGFQLAMLVNQRRYKKYKLVQQSLILMKFSKSSWNHTNSGCHRLKFHNWYKINFTSPPTLSLWLSWFVSMLHWIQSFQSNSIQNERLFIFLLLSKLFLGRLFQNAHCQLTCGKW